MALYFTYVVLGLSIALPVGTVTIEMTKQGLKNGFMHGWVVGLGGMTIDLLLIVALYFGLASVLAQPIIQSTMWLIGALFLLYVGIDSIKHASDDITLAGEAKTKSLGSSYRNGLIVAVSPGNLVFWVSSPALATAIAVTGNIPLKLTDEFVSLVGNYLTTTPAKSFL